LNGNSHVPAPRKKSSSSRELQKKTSTRPSKLRAKLSRVNGQSSLL
jgi:hypothetical protein